MNRVWILLAGPWFLADRVWHLTVCPVLAVLEAGEHTGFEHFDDDDGGPR